MYNCIHLYASTPIYIYIYIYIYILYIYINSCLTNYVVVLERHGEKIVIPSQHTLSGPTTSKFRNSATLLHGQFYNGLSPQAKFLISLLFF